MEEELEGIFDGGCEVVAASSPTLENLMDIWSPEEIVKQEAVEGVSSCNMEDFGELALGEIFSKILFIKENQNGESQEVQEDAREKSANMYERVKENSQENKGLEEKEEEWIEGMNGSPDDTSDKELRMRN